MRRLLARILMADMRDNPANFQEDSEATVTSPWGSDRDSNEAVGGSLPVPVSKREGR